MTGEPLAELGRRLRAAREKKGWTLQQASERTRITVKNLSAIEAGDLARFPAAVYVRGFVRSYANALDLDEGDELALLDTAGFTSPRAAIGQSGEAARGGRGGEPVGAFPDGEGEVPPANRLAAARRLLVPGTTALVAVVLLGFGIRGISRWSRAGSDGPVPPSPFQEQAAPPSSGAETAVRPAPVTPRPEPRAIATPVAAPGSLPVGVLLSVTAHAMCEIQYQPDTRRARWMTLNPGQSAVLTAKSQLRVLIGNPAGVRMSTPEGVYPMPAKALKAEHLLLTPGKVQKLPLPVPPAAPQ